MIEDFALWDEFNGSSPQGTVFSSSAWLDAAASAQGGELRLAAVVENGRMVAGLPWVHIARGPVRKASSPALTPYSGILYRPDPGKRHSEAESFNMRCAELFITRLKETYRHVFIAHSPGMEDIRAFDWAGFGSRVKYTYLLDIEDPDSLWELVERRVRTVIRNAEKTLVLGGAVDIGTFTTLYERIYGDRGRQLPYGSGMVKAMTERVLAEGLGEMRSAVDEDGNVLSTMILVRDERTVYAWLSGSLPGENASGAFSLLFWDAVKRYSGSHEKLDMVGANIKSIAFFKKGFAGRLTPYYVTDWYSSSIARFTFAAYTALRKVFR